MANIVAFFLFAGAALLQTTIIPRITLLNGIADVMLLVMLAWALHQNTDVYWPWAFVAGGMVGLASGMPIWIVIAEYLLVILTAQFLLSRVWQVPILVLFVTTFIGTFIVYGIDYAFLIVIGTPLPFSQSFNLVVLPGMILNIILVLPIYGLVGELAKQVYPVEVEV